MCFVSPRAQIRFAAARSLSVRLRQLRKGSGERTKVFRRGQRRLADDV